MRYIHRIIVIGIMIMLMFIGCSKEKLNEESAPVLLDSVKINKEEKTVPVMRMDVEKENVIDVIVVPKTEELFFKMTGEVLSVDVVAGQMVEEGDTLATLSQTHLDKSIETLQEEIDYQESIYGLQLEQAKVEIEIAEKQLEILQKQFEEQESKKQEVTENLTKKQEIEDDVIQEESEDADLSVNGGEYEESSKIIEDVPEGENHSGSNTEGDTNQNASIGDQENQNSLIEDSTIEQPIILEPEITQFDLQLSELSLLEVQLSYDQLMEEYNLEMAQRQEELEALLSQKGEDVLVAPFSGRILEIYCSVGSLVDEHSVAVIIADETQKILRGTQYVNTPLKREKNLKVLFGAAEFDVVYVPYDEEEYNKRILEEELPTWFEFECPDYIGFGNEGMIKINIENSINTLAVPADCVHSDEGGKFVYKAESGKKVKQYVTIGVKTDSYVEITAGLAEGDEIYGSE